jgi:hypothetical protein
VISHERGKNQNVFTTSGTYPWSFATQIFHNGQPSHGGDRKTFEVMISTSDDVNFNITEFTPTSAIPEGNYYDEV